MMQKKIVLFGAGKIGRSFIGQVFSLSGYEVVFIDINQKLIDLLNERKQYNVVIKSSTGDEVIHINNVRGIHLSDTNNVIAEVTDASLVALSVGQQGIPAVLPLLSQSLQLRQQKYENWPLDIIIAENMRNADEYMKKELIKLLPVDYPMDDLVGLVETSIGKMVPVMSNKDVEDDPLQVFAEPYNNLIVAKNGFKNTIPEVEFLAPKENIKAWVDRKLFIHNLGHTAAAYLGYKYNPHFIYIYEALEVSKIFNQVKAAMGQAASALLKKYPEDFSLESLNEHIADLLIRFQNKALGDTIFRVGCDLPRKLGINDRIIGTIRLTKEMNLPYDKILQILVCGLWFSATDENGKMHPSDEIISRLYQTELKNIIKKTSNLDMENDEEIIEEIVRFYESIHQIL